TAFADYQRIVAKEKAMRARNKKGELTADDRDELAVDLYAYRSGYLAAALASVDRPLASTKADWTRNEWYNVAAGKGVLLLHELRRLVGDPLFEETMDAFGRQYAGKPVSAAQFQAEVQKHSSAPL